MMPDPSNTEACVTPARGAAAALAPASAGTGRVLCVARVRPACAGELRDPAHRACVSVAGNRLTVEAPGGPAQEFKFDHVFDENATQEDVYTAVGAPAVEAVLAGLSATVLAYGATGTGKTHSLHGTSLPGLVGGSAEPLPESGLAVRVFAALFHRLRAESGGCGGAMEAAAAGAPSSPTAAAPFTVTASMLEIYNESVRDLLAPARRAGLALRSSPAHHAGGVTQQPAAAAAAVVQGLRREAVRDAHELAWLLQRGERARSIGGTRLNARSSRSHSVLTVDVARAAGSDGGGGLRRVVVGRLTIVDLAGSERASGTGEQPGGQRLREAQAINTSLTALGRVVAALVRAQRAQPPSSSSSTTPVPGATTTPGSSGPLRGQQPPQQQPQQPQQHVPYRDSQLTFLLQDSLGGNALCTFVGTVSPSLVAAKETLSTLAFLRRVRCVRNRRPAPRVEIAGGATAAALRGEVARLEAEAEALRAALAAARADKEAAVLAAAAAAAATAAATPETVAAARPKAAVRSTPKVAIESHACAASSSCDSDSGDDSDADAGSEDDADEPPREALVARVAAAESEAARLQALLDELRAAPQTRPTKQRRPWRQQWLHMLQPGGSSDKLPSLSASDEGAAAVSCLSAGGSSAARAAARAVRALAAPDSSPAAVAEAARVLRALARSPDVQVVGFGGGAGNSGSSSGGGGSSNAIDAAVVLPALVAALRVDVAAADAAAALANFALRSAGVRVLIAGTRGVFAALSAAVAASADSATVAEACRALANLALAPATAARLAEHQDVILALAGALRAAVPAAAAQAAWALANIAGGSDALARQVAHADGGVLPGLVAALADPTSPVAPHAARALANVAAGSVSTGGDLALEVAAAPGAIRMLVGALEAGPVAPSASENAALALAHISRGGADLAHSVAVCTPGALRALAVAAEVDASSSEPSLQSGSGASASAAARALYAAGALAAIAAASGKLARLVAAEPGAIPALRRALDAVDAAPTAATAAAALARIAACDEEHCTPQRGGCLAAALPPVAAAAAGARPNTSAAVQRLRAALLLTKRPPPVPSRMAPAAAAGTGTATTTTTPPPAATPPPGAAPPVEVRAPPTGAPISIAGSGSSSEASNSWGSSDHGSVVRALDIATAAAADNDDGASTISAAATSSSGRDAPPPARTRRKAKADGDGNGSSGHDAGGGSGRRVPLDQSVARLRAVAARLSLGGGARASSGGGDAAIIKAKRSGSGRQLDAAKDQSSSPAPPPPLALKAAQARVERLARVLRSRSQS